MRVLDERGPHLDLIADFGGDLSEEVVRKREPVRRHAVRRRDRPQCHHVVVRALVALCASLSRAVRAACICPPSSVTLVANAS